LGCQTCRPRSIPAKLGQVVKAAVAGVQLAAAGSVPLHLVDGDLLAVDHGVAWPHD